MSHSIKGVGEVKLEDEPFLLSRETRMNSFLYYEYGISYFSVGQEPSLVF